MSIFKNSHIENDKRGEMSDSTRCEEECSLPKSPHNQSDKRGEVSESTKCEDQIVQNEIREMEYLHPCIPHIQRERISELCESTKYEGEVIHHKIREMSEPQHIIPHHQSERSSELCESTKSNLEVFTHNIKEMSDPPHARREDYSTTNHSQSSLSLKYVQMQKSYLAALLQQWEDEIHEQLWRTWSTIKETSCGVSDLQKGMEVLSEVKEKRSFILKHPEVCTYELLKHWRDEIREKMFGISSMQQHHLVNIVESIKEATKQKLAHQYSTLTLPRYFVLSSCYYFVDRRKSRATFLQEREDDMNMVVPDYKLYSMEILVGRSC